MFHVKHFGTIGGENLIKPHTASSLSNCANAPETGLFGGGGRSASAAKILVLSTLCEIWIY
jgi:hypothetical protein